MPLDKVEKIWMDGDLVDWDDAKIHILTHTLHYGSGVFEGVRAYATSHGPAVFRLTDHIRRLLQSAKMLTIESPYSLDQLVEATKETVRVNDVESCYIRPLMYLGYGEMGLNPLPSKTKESIAVCPWGTCLGEAAETSGVRARVSTWQRIGANTIPPAGKATGQYLNSSLAKVEALKAGYDEAIMLTPAGNVAEGSGENLFVVSRGTIYTPPVVDGVLAGLTRDSVVTLARDEGYEVVEKSMVAPTCTSP